MILSEFDSFWLKINLIIFSQPVSRSISNSNFEFLIEAEQVVVEVFFFNSESYSVSTCNKKNNPIVAVLRICLVLLLETICSLFCALRRLEHLVQQCW